jgi:hypothetical protein
MFPRSLKASHTLYPSDGSAGGETPVAQTTAATQEWPIGATPAARATARYDIIVIGIQVVGKRALKAYLTLWPSPDAFSRPKQLRSNICFPERGFP